MSRTFRAATISVVAMLTMVTGASAAVAAPADSYQSRMAELGMNSSNSVVQIGANLYAGPSCPGGGVSCVNPDGKHIVQVVRGASGSATADCSGCIVLQYVEDGGPSAPLSASCRQGTADAPVEQAPLSQRCTIEQDNAGGGNNTATVAQFGTQRATRTSSTGAPHTVSQTLTQEATITQNASGAGTNSATVRQWSEQKAHTNNTSGTVKHLQEGGQRTVVLQDSQNGNQTSAIDQDLIQRSDARFNTGSIVQRQNATDDGRDIVAIVRQEAGNAYNTSTLAQDEVLKQDGGTVAPKTVEQVQGAPTGGLQGDVEGDQTAQPTATQASAYFADQNKDFRQDITGGIVAKQVQDDIVECCDLPFGFSRSYHDCTIDGDSLLKQRPGGDQTIVIRLLGQVDRSCTARYSAETGAGLDSGSQTGSRVAIGTNCDESSCAPNRTPTAQDVAASGNEDTAISWSPSVADPDNDGMTCSIEGQPANGTASVASNCSTGSYTPAPNFFGTDTFTYQVDDEHGFRSTPATVTITVLPVNDAPIANDDAATTDEDTSVDINVLANDSDVDGTINAGSVTVIAGPSNGSTSVLAGGAVRYTPSPNYHGSDSFTYRVADNEGATDTAVVSITVNSVTDPANSGLTLRVKNGAAPDSAYANEATVTPTQPSADYRVTYDNTGEADATNVVVRFTIPEGGSFASCTGGCTQSGGVVTWSLGTQPASAAAVDRIVRITFAITALGNVDSKMTGTATGETFESNSVRVRKQCLTVTGSSICA